MKKSEVIETIKEVMGIQLISALDPEFIGEEWAAKSNEMATTLMETTGISIFETGSDIAIVIVDALEKAGMIFDPEDD